MRGYPFITELNKNVLSKSKGIEGRFYMCPKMGTEINADDLEQVIKDEVAPTTGKKYPLAIMMPPTSYGYFTEKEGGWRKFHFIMFFLKTIYNSGTGQVQSPNASTGTSTHTIPQDWHDMDRCATNYIKALDLIQKKKGLINTSFRLDQEFEKIIRPVSFIGADRLSGVRLDYRASVFMGCELEDYTTEGINDIVIPESDSHAEHTM